MAADELPDRYNPLKSPLNQHTEQELESAIKFAMERCPEVVALMRGERVDIEIDGRMALSRLYEALRMKMPDITLAEMAHAALSISLKLRPMTDESIQSLDELEERSKKNRAIIKARLAQRKS
jgi:hypothetical protein